MTMYTVRIIPPSGDYTAERYIDAESLAALCNIIRGWCRKVGTHYSVWSSADVQLIDTRFGDSYNLTGENSELQV